VDERSRRHVICMLVLTIGFGETIQRRSDLFIIRGANATRLRE
jgi:hypothetical protein